MAGYQSSPWRHRPQRSRPQRQRAPCRGPCLCLPRFLPTAAALHRGRHPGRRYSHQPLPATHAPPPARRQAKRPIASASGAAAAAAPGAALPSRQQCDRLQNLPSGFPWCPEPGAPRLNHGRRGVPAAPPPRSPRDGSDGQQRAATEEIPERLQRQADSSVRPLRRRAAMMARPARVRMRNRNPWVFARRRLFGWNVRLPLVTAVRSPGGRFSLRGRSRRDCAIVGSSPASTGGIAASSSRPVSRSRLPWARARKNARR
jgi:hypothetical protein